jgi:hypothetical protein
MTLLFSILPNEIVDKIYDMSGYKNELKTYFQRNVLTLVDPTLCFLSNKHCIYCFIRECEIRNGQDSFVREMEIRNGQKNFSKICFKCRRKRDGNIMVSIHDTNKQ